MTTMMRLFSRKREQDHEDASMERLENAERELGVLKRRATIAVDALNARHDRNHWRESVEQMIQGRA